MRRARGRRAAQAADSCALRHKNRPILCDAATKLTKLRESAASSGWQTTEPVLLKLFITGIVLGIASAAGLLYAVPVVDQHREASLVKVAPNGGTVESFRINLPQDSIIVRHPGEGQTAPANIDWPQDERFRPVRIELFKLRNERNVVVGLAARSATVNANGVLVDWVLHLPARGSQFLSMQPEVAANGFRGGVLRAGSREFANRSGSMMVRQVTAQQGATGGRIELTTNYIGKQGVGP